MIETVDRIRAMLADHIRIVQRDTAALGGELAKRWGTIDLETRRAIQRRLRRGFKHTRTLIAWSRDEAFLATWCANINNHPREVRPKRVQELFTVPADPRPVEDAVIMIDGLLTRDVQ